MNQSHPVHGGQGHLAHGVPGHSAHPAHTGHTAHATPVQTADLEPIGLVDEEPQAALETAKKIKAFGIAGMEKKHEWKRQTNVTSKGAVRMRSFHGRLSDEGLTFMDDKINEWLDAHPEVEVKFVTSTVGTYEGKIREPALVLNVWY